MHNTKLSCSLQKRKSDNLCRAVRQALLGVLGAVTVPLLYSASAGAQAPAPIANSSSSVYAVKGRILVQPKAGLSVAELDKALKPHGGKRVGHLRQINVFVIELPGQASETAVINALRGNPHIKFAEPDVLAQPSMTVNDTYFASQWHLPKIGATAAWDLRTGNGVTVAVLDSGVDASHPDFAGQLVPGWNTFDNNNNTADVYGHGTMVAGTVGAVANNSTGVAGVSFGSRIMPIRVTDTSGYGYYSTIASGITWAADNGARVANISFLGISASSAILSAAQYMRSKGGVVVTSSGNTGALESYAPSEYLTVAGATTSTDYITTFSSYGNYVDIVAPGYIIYTTARGGSYVSASGTSFSSPIVASIYALTMSANPALMPSTLDNIVFTTATDLLTAGKDEKSGWGLVNASAAVTKAMQSSSADASAPSVSITSPSAAAKVSGLVSVSVSATDNVGVTRTELYLNNALYASEVTAPFGFSIDTSGMPDGSASLMAKAFDAAGNVGSSSAIAITVANDTEPPVASIQTPASGSVVTGTVNVTASATDNKQVAKLSLVIDGKEVAQAFGSTLSYSWNTGGTTKKKGGKAGASSGTRTLKLTATDAAGNSATSSVTVTSQ